MSLTALLTATIGRLRVDNPLVPSNIFIFGFVTPEESASVRFGNGSASVEPHLKKAKNLVYGTVEEIASLSG